MSKQYSAKTMFDQSVIYLFNSYVEQGMTMEQASQAVANDIEQVHTKYRERGVVPATSILNNPVTKIDIAMSVVDQLLKYPTLGMHVGQVERHYRTHLTGVNKQLGAAKQMLEK